MHVKTNALQQCIKKIKAEPKRLKTVLLKKQENTSMIKTNAFEGIRKTKYLKTMHSMCQTSNILCWAQMNTTEEFMVYCDLKIQMAYGILM